MSIAAASAFQDDQNPPASFEAGGNGARSRRCRFGRRFLIRYVHWLEWFGYALVLAVTAVVVASFWIKTDDLITATGVAILPREETVKSKDALFVTRLLVTNHQEVKKGDPLMEGVADPIWAARLSALADLKALETKWGGNPDTATVLQTVTAQRIALETQIAADGVPPTIVVPAPATGMVVLPKDFAAGQQRETDSELAKVLDFNDLRLSADKLGGETVMNAQVGQKAVIRAIVPNFGTGTILRADVEEAGSRREEHFTSRMALDAKLKETVKTAYQGKTLTAAGDLAFEPTNVSDMEVSVLVNAQPQPSDQGTVLLSDTPTELTLQGRVVEGRHKIKVQFAALPPGAGRETVQKAVAAALRDRRVESTPEKAGDPVRTYALRNVKNIQVIARIEGERAPISPAENTERQIADARQNALMGSPIDRSFAAEIQITNPPDFLKRRLREVILNGKDMKASVDVVTGRRPIAFLLLKR